MTQSNCLKKSQVSKTNKWIRKSESPLSVKETKLIIKTTFTQKTLGLESFTGVILVLTKSFKEEEMLFNLLYKTSVILIPKHDKNMTRKDKNHTWI